MRRNDFLKMLGVGMAGVIINPIILKPSKEIAEIIKPSYAIDINSISHFIFGGKKISATEILQLWRETGILVYNSHFGNPPIVFKGEIEVIDYSNKF